MEIKKEEYPESQALLEKVQKNERWSPVYRAKLEELFLSPAFRSALNEILETSDDMLRNIGATDFTNEDAIKNALRAQGIAQGLTQAVELICDLASTPENPVAEENKDV